MSLCSHKRGVGRNAQVLRAVVGMTVFFCGVCIAAQAAAYEPLAFSGTVDLRHKQCRVEIVRDEKPVVILAGQYFSENEYRFSVTVDHLLTVLFDLSGDMTVAVTLSRSTDGSGKILAVDGKITSNYALVDYRPIKDLAGAFTITGKRLGIKTFSVGDLSVSGVIELTATQAIQLAVQVDGVDLADFLSFWTRELQADAGGPVTGEIGVGGSIMKPFLKGNLVSRNGYIGKLKYDSIHLSVEGQYPQLDIRRCIITSPDQMSFSVVGSVDLSRPKTLKAQIEALTLAPVVDESEEGATWTLKRSESGEKTSTAVKYFLRQDETLGHTAQEESGILGVERRVEF